MLSSSAATLLAWAAGPGKIALPFDPGQFVGLLRLGSIGLATVFAILVVAFIIRLGNAPGRANVRPGWIYAALATFVVLFALFLVADHYDQSKISVAEHDRRMKAQKAESDEIIDTMKNMNKISGKISRPKEGETPGKKKIECAGTVSKFHKESGLHLWLAVEVNGFIWPKEPESDVNPSGEWTAPIFQDGPEAPFSIDLLVVNDRTHQDFSSWIRGAAFRSWPGPTVLSGWTASTASASRKSLKGYLSPFGRMRAEEVLERITAQ